MSFFRPATRPPHETSAATSPWSPFEIPLFRMLWLATLVSNTGAWMHDIGAGWLMTSLSPTPVMVALVQTATTLPIFFLAVPAGALADIIDRRRYLLVVLVWMALVAACLGILTLAGMTTAWSLVALTFAMGIGAAMMMPAWSAVTPEVVPRAELQTAIALNSLAMNVARAVGPAVAGVVVSLAGSGAVFMLNALSYIGVFVVLLRWRRNSRTSELPTERFFGALRSGLRFARHSPELQAAVIRGCGFFLFASAAWALLPLIARYSGGGPQGFGLLVASIGAGAVGGAFLLPRLRRQLSRDALVAAASLLYAGSMLALATLHQLPLLCLAMAASGVAWISVLSSLQVAAQMALPNWVRSRGLAVFMMAFMGSMALGSLVWGKIAEVTSIPVSLMLAATGIVIAIGLTWRWRISGIGAADLSPSMHWPTAIVHTAISHDRGPVLITIQYAVREEKTAEFLNAIRDFGKRRRRDGAYAWSLFEHTTQPSHFIESFNVESWLDYLRQRERGTSADHVLQAYIHTLLTSDGEPVITHYVAPENTFRDR